MLTAVPDIESFLPWIEFVFSRSPGPGGQNVNKVSTRVTLLFDFAQCPALTPAQKARVRRHFKTRIARDGRLRVAAHRARTQARNRAATEARLVALLSEVWHTPKPRRPTRPTLGSQKRRLTVKRQRGEVKQQRRRKPNTDDG